MTDYELAVFLGMDDDERWQQAIDRLPPHVRKVYEQLHAVHLEMLLYERGERTRLEVLQFINSLK